uniref:Uncharacterized protein n=1 Tax=Arundo donax TaxID=35708 RepID=A0A0A9BYU3_ARUDO
MLPLAWTLCPGAVTRIGGLDRDASNKLGEELTP